MNHSCLRLFVTSLAVTAALAVTACGSDDRVDTTGASVFACEGGASNILPDIKTTTPFAYVEIRSESDQERTSEYRRGTLCEGAVDMAKCQDDYRNVSFDGAKNRLFRVKPGDFGSTEIVIVSDRDGLKVLKKPEEVIAWLAPIDSAGDAVAVAEVSGYDVYCNDKDETDDDAVRTGVGIRGGGYRVVATRLIDICPVVTKQYLLQIGADGSAKELESETIGDEDEDEMSCY